MNQYQKQRDLTFSIARKQLQEMRNSTYPNTEKTRARKLWEELDNCFEFINDEWIRIYDRYQQYKTTERTVEKAEAILGEFKLLINKSRNYITSSSIKTS